MRKERLLGNAFEYEWNNPPKPFNPEYKSYAKDCWDEAMETVDREERFAGTKWSRPYRAKRRRETYDKLMEEKDGYKIGQK